QLFSEFGLSQTYIDKNEDEIADTATWKLTVNGKIISNEDFKERPNSSASLPLRTIWYLAEPYSSYPRIFLKSPAATILNTDRWPTEFNHFYQCWEEAKQFISCTVLWRYASLFDLDSILLDVKEAQRRLPRLEESSDAPGPRVE